MHRKPLTLFLTLCLLAACDKPSQKPLAIQTAPPADVASAWLGRWTGPEGTYLEVLKDGTKVNIAIRNLDGVRTFEALSTNDGLTFERDGTKESIKSGSGRDTGMKWLQHKSTCLVVKLGEGYCRQ